MSFTNADLIRTRRRLMDVLLPRQQWSEAYDIARQLLESYRVLYEGYHPSISLQAYMVFKLAEWCFPDDPALLAKLGEEAVKLLKLSHGPGTTICREAEEHVAKWMMAVHTLENCEGTVGSLPIKSEEPIANREQSS